MLTLNSPEVVQATTKRWRESQTIALVPTMGALHEGHLGLVRRAKALADKVIVSLFVNPLQFGPNEDFAKYPRLFEQDSAMLEELNIDLLFHPQTEDLYPNGFTTTVKVGPLADRLCGKFRPGHFDGVATVCLKLFEISQANLAIFGEKDFQQLTVLRRMATDFNLPLSLVAEPTRRDSDGVALSSRNAYLSEQEREWARAIPKALETAKQLSLGSSRVTVEEVLAAVLSQLERYPLKIQYAEITEGPWLNPTSPSQVVSELSLPRLFVAVYAGQTRLIDNTELSGETL